MQKLRDCKSGYGKGRGDIMFRVLVVDDEPSALDYICNIIKLKCPSLAIAGTAENGKDGLNKYRQLAPDLVISDVKMPVMGGLEMVKAIKEEDGDAQIVLVSGYQEFEYVKAALRYGVSDYVLKPMTRLILWLLWNLY